MLATVTNFSWQVSSLHEVTFPCVLEMMLHSFEDAVETEILNNRQKLIVLRSKPLYPGAFFFFCEGLD